MGRLASQWDGNIASAEVPSSRLSSQTTFLVSNHVSHLAKPFCLIHSQSIYVCWQTVEGVGIVVQRNKHKLCSCEPELQHVDELFKLAEPYLLCLQK